MLSDPMEDLTTTHEVLDTDYAVTDEQIASLHEHGWARVPGLLSEVVVEDMRKALSDVESFDTSGGQYAALTMKFSAGWRKPLMRRIATSRRLAGTVLQLTGQPTAVFAQDVSFDKAVGCPMAPFHQDHPHFPFDRKGCLTLWIALVDMTEEMGPLQYLEDTHLDGPLGFAGDPEVLEAFPELKERRVVGGGALAAGDAQAHWDMTVHGTGPNNGAIAREAWAVRYVRPDTVYNGVSHSHFDQFGLTRGDRFGEIDAFPQVGSGGLITH